MTTKEKQIEALADYAHDAWSRWMRHLFSKGSHVSGGGALSGSFLILSSSVERWERQMNTEYLNLPESEKESDRKEARKILEILDE